MQMRPKRRDQLEIEVESLAFGGRGVCRSNGFVVFVEGALPGDRIFAEVTKSKKNYAEARLLRVVEAGPDRIPAACTHSGEPCPGAPWQGLAYFRQLEVKAGQVGDALERIGGLKGFELEPITAARSVWRYRNKLEYSFGECGSGALALGFHRRGDWRSVVDVDDCMLASKASNDIRNFTRDLFKGQSLKAYDSRSGEGFLRNLIVREGSRTGQMQVRLVTSDAEGSGFDPDLFASSLHQRFSQIKGVVWTVASEKADAGHREIDDLLYGVEWFEEEVAGLRFRIPYGAFFQTNSEMMEYLVEAVTEYAGLDGTESVFDLYCGIGTLGLKLAGGACSVNGVDVVEDAVLSANENAELNHIGNAHFYCGNARTAIRPLIEKAGEADICVLDPPRAGLSEKVVRRVLETGARRIVYVSCNPATLAPNAAQVVAAGYRLVKVRPVDMFPNTPHIECVALFER